MSQEQNGTRYYKVVVLLVDDQQIIGEMVKRILAHEEDIEFHYCHDPAKAIQIANEVSPTVILQDLVMPDVDGLTLVKLFRENPATKDVPLVVLSSEEDSKIKAEAFALTANDYLVKLPDKIELLARIRHHSAGYINMLEKREIFEAMEKSRKALAYELAEAADYVYSLLPPPLDGEIEVRWKFVSSTSLGGDAFGYRWLDDDNFAMYLLDVSGHGVGVALLSVSAIEVLRSQALSNTDYQNPSSVLSQLNKTFKMQEHNDKYFTIWYGVFNKAKRTITYSCGGHPPAVLITGDSFEKSELKLLKNSCPIIGAMDDSEYENAVVELGKFNTLFIFSDGAYEIMMPNGLMWDFNEFVKFFNTAGNSKPPEVENIYEEVVAVNQGKKLDDDFSMLRLTFQ